jgi:hypothetical protein
MSDERESNVMLYLTFQTDSTESYMEYPLNWLSQELAKVEDWFIAGMGGVAIEFGERKERGLEGIHG